MGRLYYSSTYISTKLLLLRQKFLLKNDCIIRSTLLLKTLIIGSREYLRIKSKEHKNLYVTLNVKHTA